MGYLKKRLSQKSTWFGLATAVTAFIASGMQFTPEVMAALAASFGLVHVDA